MKTYNIYDAKTHLSKIIKETLAGEEVSIARNGEPLVDLKPHQPQKNKIKFGFWKGLVDFPDDALVGIDPDIQEMFYGKDWDK